MKLKRLFRAIFVLPALITFTIPIIITDLIFSSNVNEDEDFFRDLKIIANIYSFICWFIILCYLCFVF